jgi:hypothetical protein
MIALPIATEFTRAGKLMAVLVFLSFFRPLDKYWERTTQPKTSGDHSVCRSNRDLSIALCPARFDWLEASNESAKGQKRVFEVIFC